eukprot:766051-Hanusia_phi.AAC.2
MAETSVAPTKIAPGNSDEPISVEFSQRPSMVEFPKEYQSLLSSMDVTSPTVSQKDRSSHGSDGNVDDGMLGSRRRSSNTPNQSPNGESTQDKRGRNVYSIESTGAKKTAAKEEAAQRKKELPASVGSKCGIGAQEANMEAIEVKRCLQRFYFRNSLTLPNDTRVNGKVGITLKKIPGRPYHIHSVARSSVVEKVVKPGDYVHSIDGNRIEFLGPEEVENMMTGQTGSSVSLLISRNDFVETCCLSSSFGLGLAMDEVESSSKTRRIKRLVISDVASLSSLRNLIKKGDEILQFDGRAVSEMDSAEIANFVAGEKGSKIPIMYKQARTNEVMSLVAEHEIEFCRDSVIFSEPGLKANQSCKKEFAEWVSVGGFQIVRMKGDERFIRLGDQVHLIDGKRSSVINLNEEEIDSMLWGPVGTTIEIVTSSKV